MMSGGNSRTTFSPAAAVSSPSLRAATITSACGAANADQQALAANFRDHRRMPVLEFGEPLLDAQAALADMIEKAGRENDVEDGVADRRRERIAAEGRAVRAGGHALRGFGGR